MTVARANAVNFLPLDLSTLKLTDEQFYQLCVANPEQPLELTAEGVLVFVSSVGGGSGSKESKLNARVFNWNEETQLGEVFSSSTVFKLPNGSQKSPDVAWVRVDREVEILQSLTTLSGEAILPDFTLDLSAIW